jgi:FtsZ-binding cell division protein ZapB
MLEDMIKELDEKVEFLMERNNIYRQEIERLRGMLDEINSKNYTPQQSNTLVFDKLKPLLESAENVLERIKNADKEE